MSYINLEAIKHMIEEEFGYKNLVIEEIQIGGRFYKVKDNLRIHYQERAEIERINKTLNSPKKPNKN